MPPLLSEQSSFHSLRPGSHHFTPVSIYHPWIEDIENSPPQTPSRSSRRGSSPQKSPLRRLFDRTILPLSPSTSSFFTSTSPTSPSRASQRKEWKTFEVHLVDFGAHSEIRFDPVSSLTQNDTPRTPIYDTLHRVHSPTENSAMGYGITCTKMTEKEVILSCKDDKGDNIAKLRTSIRGSQIDIRGQEERIWLEEGGKGIGGQKLYVEDSVYQWAESNGLAILVNLQNRHKLAKLHFNVLARDKLVISEEGMGDIPLIIMSAAKLWSEHKSERDLRLK